MVVGGLGAAGLYFASQVMWVVDSSRRSSCVSNVLQISRMSLLYASDHDEFLPPVFTFQPGAGNGEKLVTVLAPYQGGEALHCPSDEPEFRREEVRRVEGTGKLGYVHDQGLSAFFRSAGQVQLINLSKVPDPSKVLFFRDPIRSIHTRGGEIEVGSPHGKFFVGSYLDGGSAMGLKHQRGSFQ